MGTPVVTRSAGLEPRRAALRILGDVRQGRPFDATLDRVAVQLSDSDRRLSHELAAGVLRQRSALDQKLSPLVSRDWSQVDPLLQDILRLGAYQLTQLARVPAHAAVDTSVALAKRARGTRAAGFVNAVLRQLTRTEPQGPDTEREPVPSLAQDFSHPGWLVERWIRQLGQEQTERLLRWNNTRPRLVAQPGRRTLEQLEQEWHDAGIDVSRAPYGAGLVLPRTRPTELPGYREGHFIIQDPAQALLARFAELPTGATVYDACAAPGGKSIALGRSSGLTLAGEISRQRARRLADNLARAGSGREHAVVADARQPPIRTVDVVLLDAPCTGTGTFARHPDARWRISPEALDRIAELQRRLLSSTAAAVRPAGLLVYSTCSLEPEENEGQVEWFLQEHPEFEREPGTTVPSSLLTRKGDLLILPQLHRMDGAYAARLRRRK